MKRFRVVALAIVIGVLEMTGCSRGSGSPVAAAPVTAQPAAPKKTLRAFTSDQELRSYFKELADKQKRRMARTKSVFGLAAPMASKVASPIAGYENDSITNVQQAGVDEGGIVKLHGDHLVVLHRGRLFTVAIGADDLTPISSVDAFGPDIDPRATWYAKCLFPRTRSWLSGIAISEEGPRSVCFTSMRMETWPINLLIICDRMTIIHRATTQAA